MAYRKDRWKYNYMLRKQKGMKVWREPMDKLRAPVLEDLRADPFEYAYDHASNYYEKWFMDHAFLILPSAEEVALTSLPTSNFHPGNDQPLSM